VFLYYFFRVKIIGLIEIITQTQLSVAAGLVTPFSPSKVADPNI
jgi:hypothetical protein